jgi:1-deoxy-D-xylulose-5-phosphate reductoisomerase
MNTSRKIVILGSSGSIGQTALKLLSSGRTGLEVVGLAVRRDTESLLRDAERFNVRHIAVADREAARALRARLPEGLVLHEGDEGVEELAGMEADVLLCALVGMAGLRPVLRAIETGKDIALATKEVLVAAGEIVMRERERRGVRITPVDSEHSAIFQCLQSAAYAPACVRTADDAGRRAAEDSIRRLILTASGGPFAFRPELDFDKVTVADALNHPRWKMGRKITVDSASMMNKGLEIIEARWLFNIPVDRIDVLVHPESIVHSLVEFIDGTQLAELSVPDMTFAINYALTWPFRTSREDFGFKPGLLDLAEAGALHFSTPDPKRFPALRLAREAVAAGGTYTAALNGANEVAVQAFLDGRIKFSAIWRIVEEALAAHKSAPSASNLDEVFEADRSARVFAELCVERLRG